MVVVIGTRILVKNVEELEKTAGGLFIPDGAQEKPAEGEIIAIGEKVEGINIGDKVFYGKYSGTEIKPEDEELLVMDALDILAIVREDGKDGDK
jgi:chaperonin GroES